MFNAIRDVISIQTGIDKNDIQMESTWNGLNIDSLDLVNILLDLENVFDIELPDEDMEGMRTVGNLVTYVESKIDNQILSHMVKVKENKLSDEMLKEMVSNANEAGWRLKPISSFKEKTLTNALNGFAPEAADERIVAFMDTTILGSGKAGFLLTDRAIYSPEFTFSKAAGGKKRIPLKDLIIFGPAEEGKQYFQFVYIDGTRLIAYCTRVYIEGFMALVQTAMKGSVTTHVEDKTVQQPKSQKTEPAYQKPAQEIIHNSNGDKNTKLSSDIGVCNDDAGQKVKEKKSQPQRTINTKMRSTIAGGGISCNDAFAAICNDGTVLFSNVDGCTHFKWDDIIFVTVVTNNSTNSKDKYGLIAIDRKGDAHIPEEDNLVYLREKILKWHDLVGIECRYNVAVGLKRDGDVLFAGYGYGENQNPVRSWHNIVAVSVGHSHILGLKDDGTVLAVGIGNNNPECDVDSWKNIIAVSAGYGISLGLKADGTVVATGDNEYGDCNVNEWKDIVSIGASDVGASFGLTKFGTILNTRNADYDDFEDWNDIIEIAVGTLGNIIGLRPDGAVRSSSYVDVDEWKDLVIPKKL